MDAIDSTPPHTVSRCVRSASLLLGFVLASTFGCRANCDLVEADLRAKEAQLAELRQALGQRDCNIQALEMEIAQLQRQCAQPPPGAPVPVGMVVKQIKLGRLTGGFDDEPLKCGDEGLQVLVEPQDCDNQSIKVPGALHLEVYEVTPQGLKIPLSTWDFTAPELRRKWDTPIFGSAAYRLTLPWKSWPMTEKLRVVATFITLDGQRYEADKDVTVRLAGNQPQVRRDACSPTGMPTSGPQLTPPPEEVIRAPQPSSQPPPPEPMTPPSPVPEKPSEIAPASYVRPVTEQPRSPVGVSLEAPVKTRWKPVQR